MSIKTTRRRFLSLLGLAGASSLVRANPPAAPAPSDEGIAVKVDDFRIIGETSIKELYWDGSGLIINESGMHGRGFHCGSDGTLRIEGGRIETGVINSRRP